LPHLTRHATLEATMFRRRTPRPDAAPAETGGEAFTYVHGSTVVRGAIEATGRVRVHGTVRGDVRVDGVLEVAQGGLVEGERVEADEVRILGVVRASVHAAVRVEIWKHGTLEGDVTTAALDIEEGATFVGRSMMAPRSGEIAAIGSGADRSADPEAGPDAGARASAVLEPAPG
jgi:cytoskeletal protein CcmA (bactofilin family)